jgi:hypothetical protein
MLDALVMIHDVTPNVDTIFVIRQVDEDPTPGQSAQPANVTPTPSGPGAAPIDPLAPRSEANFGRSNVALLQTAGDAGAPARGATPPDRQILLPNGQPAGANEPATVTPGAPATSEPAAPTAPAPITPVPAPAFQFSAPKAPAETRVIRIPLDSLKNGDLRYNVVIRPRDLLVAPTPIVGEYYMGGHIARTGVYSLSGRKITLKEAVISAGMLDGLAIPQRCDIIRRLGTDREVFARVNLDAIFDGTQPDIFLKPYDSVMVGTNLPAFFINQVRTGGRITYGAGFLYDRNYAPQQSIGG